MSRCVRQKNDDTPEPIDSLLRNLPGNIVRRVLHPDGRFTYAFLSSGLRDTFDIEPDDITSEQSVDFGWIHPEDRAGFRAALLSSAENLTSIDLENRVIGRDGAVRWVRSIATTRRVADGRVIWDGIALDVTDKRRAEDEQRAALARAQAADEAKTKFLAAASHDLRQPLQAMRFLLEGLKIADGADARAAATADLERCLGAMDALLSALLDISKLDAGLVAVTEAPVALAPLIHELVAEASPMAEAADVRFDVACDDGAAVTDPALFASICRNLLQNAVKFSPPGGLVTVRARSAPRPLLVIADRGPGVPPCERRRVFEPFVQLSNAARDRSQGLGLGLAIVARSAALIGATAAARGRPGGGALFAVRLPPGATASTPPEGAPQPAAAPGDDLAGREIWLLEDDVMVRDALAALLRRWGVRVAAVSTAAELDALAATRAEPPDALVADFRLASRRTGGAAVADVRARFKVEVPGVILTGDTDPGRLRDALSMGCLLLHKPVKAGRLKAALRALVSEGSAAATEERDSRCD